MARKDALQGQKAASPRPFLKWAGGKSQLLPEIMPYYPFAEGRLTRYVEPFVGAGAVLFDILGRFELQSVYIGDCNTELVNTYVCLRDYPEERTSVQGRTDGQSAQPCSSSSTRPASTVSFA